MMIKLQDMDDETIENIVKLQDGYNYLLPAYLNLVEHLSSQGMKMRDIYAIAEQPLKAKEPA